MAQFAFETVSAGVETVRGQCSLTLDRDGCPHVAYAVAPGQVVIASRINGTWVREKLDAGPLARGGDEDRIWLEIDQQGNPHVALIESGSSRLFHGVRLNGRWSFTPVPSNFTTTSGTGVVHASFRLAHGGSNPELRDTPHFIFSDLTSDSMGYARAVGGQFKLFKADPSVDIADGISSRTGMCSSMAFDPWSQTIQLAYVETVGCSSRLNLRRVTDVFAGNFAQELQLDIGPFVIAATSVVAQDTSTWVAYGDVTNRALMAATRIGGENSIESVATVAGRVVPSLAQNPAYPGELQDRLRIAYADDGKIKLARRQRFDGWTVEVVDPHGGVLPSLAYDRLGNAHLAYAADGRLKYATRED